MHILLVYAHQDPTSFGAALHNTSLRVLEKAGHTVVVSDLYGEGFNPVPAVWDFVTTPSAHASYLAKQKFAQENKGFSEEIKREIDRLKKADLIIFEFPLWWSGPPAIVKGWLDKILAYGVAWDGDHRYNKGLLKGKQAMTIVTAGDPGRFYASSGVHKASVVQHLYPLLHSTLALCGMDVHQPYVVSGLTMADREQRQVHFAPLEERLRMIELTPQFLYRHA